MLDACLMALSAWLKSLTRAWTLGRAPRTLGQAGFLGHEPMRLAPSSIHAPGEIMTLDGMTTHDVPKAMTLKK